MIENGLAVEEIEETRSAAATAEELEALARVGFFTRRGYFSDAEVDALEALADRAVAYHNTFPPHLADLYKSISTRDGITFVNEFGDDSDVAAELKAFAMQPRLARMARSIAGEHAAHHCYQIVYKHPHFDRPFPWHQDQTHTPSDRRFFNVWVAISDMTVANGCLWMLPAVGLDQILGYEETPFGYACWPLEGADQGVPIELPRGSIVVNTSWTLHKSGGNTTASTRKAMLTAFLDDRSTQHGEPIRMTPYRSA
jgi:ectoine hydroxylase-related dioxygenase (phytanoyl-CoA dioxygenase family)